MEIEALYLDAGNKVRLSMLNLYTLPHGQGKYRTHSVSLNAPFPVMAGN